MLKIAWHPQYRLELPPKHRFPMIKYELLPEQLLYEGTVRSENFFRPGSLALASILNTHTEEYWNKLHSLSLSRQEVRASGFPLSRELVERETCIAQGTIDCSKYALEFGVAMNIAGGTHHAFSNRGEGFCLLNDIAIAANDLLENSKSKQVLVIDLDVHQGNGTAEIFRNTPEVFTFSMHGAKNYPLRKEQSDLDVGLPDGTEDREYLSVLDQHLEALLEQVQPDFVFYLAGVDVLASDKLGRLALSQTGCRERDRRVLALLAQHKIPCVVNMGGGYSPRIADIINAHSNTYRLVQEIFF